MTAQMDEWRATIQSLLGFAEDGVSRRAGLPRPPQALVTAHGADCTEGAIPMVQSPPRQPARAQQSQDHEDASMASSDPRVHPSQRQAPEDGRRGGAPVVIEQRRDDLHRIDGCDGLNVDEPTLGFGGCLPFEVGCPAFTRELQQVHWLSIRTFKPEITKKYDGRLNPVDFLSIYTIAVQAAGGRDEKVFAKYFPLALKSNVRSWLMHLSENSISSWADL